MTRQKKELIKRIEEIEKEIAIDWDLSFGCAPPGAYDEMNDEIWELQEQLAKLRHYNSAEEMFYDSRWPDPEMMAFPQIRRSDHKGSSLAVCK